MSNISIFQQCLAAALLVHVVTDTHHSLAYQYNAFPHSFNTHGEIYHSLLSLKVVQTTVHWGRARGNHQLRSVYFRGKKRPQILNVCIFWTPYEGYPDIGALQPLFQRPAILVYGVFRSHSVIDDTDD